MRRSRPWHVLSVLFAVALPLLGPATPALAGADTVAPPEHPLARLSDAEGYRIRPSLRILLGSQPDASLETAMRTATARLVDAAGSRPQASMVATLVLSDALSAEEVVAFQAATGFGVTGLTVRMQTANGMYAIGYDVSLFEGDLDSRIAFSERLHRYRVVDQSR